MTTDLTPFLSATPAAILAVAVATSLLKPFLERTVLPAQAPLHDGVVRLGAVLLGVALVVGATLLNLTPHQTAAGGLLFGAAIEGAKAGIFAVAAYHLLTGSVFEPNAGVAVQPTAPALASTVNATDTAGWPWGGASSAGPRPAGISLPASSSVVPHPVAVPELAPPGDALTAMTPAPSPDPALQVP